MRQEPFNNEDIKNQKIMQEREQPHSPQHREESGSVLLELSQVSRSFHAFDQKQPLHILRAINLVVHEGSRIAIIGRSGSGKSSLLNIMGLLDDPTGGVVTYRGKPLKQLPYSRREKIRSLDIGFVFQQFNLLHGRTALDNVVMPLLYGSSDNFWHRKERSIMMLNRVGLGERLHHKVEKLSGGEQQRVAIARALVKSPQLIFADEPTGALDIETGDAVMSLLEEVSAQHNSALITITHDTNIALRSDTIFRLADGVLTPVDAAQLEKVVTL